MNSVSERGVRKHSRIFLVSLMYNLSQNYHKIQVYRVIEGHKESLRPSPVAGGAAAPLGPAAMLSLKIWGLQILVTL